MATLIYYDQAGHQSAQQEAASVADRFTHLLSLYHTLGVPATVATADLPGLLADPTSWLVQKWLGGADGPLLLGGLPINPAKALELIERPAGFDAFIQQGHELAAYLAPRAVQGVGPIIREASSYAVVGGRQVSLTAAASAALEKRHKYYTTNARQDALLRDLQGLSETLGRLTASGVVHEASFDRTFLSGALVVSTTYGNSAATTFRPNPAFILSQFAS